MGKITWHMVLSSFLIETELATNAMINQHVHLCGDLCQALTHLGAEYSHICAHALKQGSRIIDRLLQILVVYDVAQVEHLQEITQLL